MAASIEIPLISITLGFLLFSSFALGSASNYAGQEKYSESESVVVVGKVFCDTCLEHRLSENGYVISGASIAVECGLNRKAMSLSVTGETDENGEFKVEIPSYILRLADGLNKCWVRPRNSPYHSCRIPSTSAPSKLTLQSDSNGVFTYSAGALSYRHQTVPPTCYREDFLRMMRGRAMAEDVDQSSKAGQQTPTIPSLPTFPPATLPTVPPLAKTPPLPGIPSLPSVPPLPKISPLPQFGVPPLPKISPIPQFSVPPFPKISPLPQFSVPPLPQLSFPPFPKPPTIPNSPPLPFVTPPPPSQKTSP